MKAMRQIVHKFAMLSTAFLVFNFFAIPVFQEEIFGESGAVTMGGELIILIGFVSIALFNIISILYFVGVFVQKADTQNNFKVLTLGIFCLILMVGEKTLIDEIAHEYQIGWETTGEWIILYLFMLIQLFYNFVILKRHRHFFKIHWI